MSTVQLPDGHTAQLRDPDDLPVWAEELLQRKGAGLFALISERWPNVKNMEEVPFAELGEDGMAKAQQFNRAGVIALLESWTRPEPLPTMDTLGDVPRKVNRALMEAVAPLILPAMLGDNYTPSPANRADPETPTEPSSD